MEIIIIGHKLFDMKIFKDEKLNNEFLNQGFTKFRLLTENQVAELKQFYYNEVNETQQQLTNGGFHTTSNTNDNELLNRVDTFNKSILLPELNKHMEQVIFTISNFLVKESTPDSVVPPHQDWLLVDEEKYTSFNVWVCLDAANSQTGEMKFIPGSQRLSNSHRANGIPRYFDNFSNQLNSLFVHVSTLPGECVVFHHSIIHASDANVSGKKRLSCVLGGFYTQAELLFFLPNPENQAYLQKFKINPSTLMKMGPNYTPTIDVISKEIIQGNFEKWTYKQFIQQLKKKYPATKLTFIDKIKLIFR